MASKLSLRLARLINLCIVNFFFKDDEFDVDCVRLGSSYGGWYVPRDFLLLCLQDEYFISAGVGEDISFDLELIKWTGMKGIIIDPTERSFNYISSFSTDSFLNLRGIRTITSATQNLSSAEIIGPERLIFINKALWKDNGGLKLFPPDNPRHVSYSLRGKGDGESFETISFREILSSKQKVKLIKLDIEGSEIKVLDSLVRLEKECPQILLFELDFLRKPRIFDTLSFFRIAFRLSNLGYKLLKLDGFNVSLAKVQEI